jgi:predicted HAD superfamily Cof-like phosphohydrolase
MYDEMIRKFFIRQGQPMGNQGPLRTRVSADERFLRLRLITSELGELADAMGIDDRVEIADALADMMYVIIGTGITYGIPVLDCLTEVHASNMTKESKTLAPGEKGGVKGNGYQPPNLKAILERYQELYDQMTAEIHERVSRATQAAKNSDQRA